MTLQQNNTDQSLPLGLYRHYKGREYELLGLAQHAETDEPMVVYRCLYGKFDLWVRTRADFVAGVEIGGEVIPRFVFVGPSPSKPTFDDEYNVDA